MATGNKVVCALQGFITPLRTKYVHLDLDCATVQHHFQRYITHANRCSRFRGTAN